MTAPVAASWTDIAPLSGDDLVLLRALLLCEFVAQTEECVGNQVAVNALAGHTEVDSALRRKAAEGRARLAN